MGRPYTPQEIEELRRGKDKRRRWLILNGGERFNLRTIIERLQRDWKRKISNLASP